MKHVLFVGNHSAGRSQMAQAFFNRDAREGVRAESAGSNPARHVWPEVVEVMREVDISSPTSGRATPPRDAAAGGLGGDDGV